MRFCQLSKAMSLLEPAVKLRETFVPTYKFRDISGNFQRKLALSDLIFSKILYVTDNTLENKVAKRD